MQPWGAAGGNAQIGLANLIGNANLHSQTGKTAIMGNFIDKILCKFCLRPLY